MNDLITAFEEYFEVIVADTQELREKVFRLRYQVYCEEIKGIDHRKFPHGLETDDYDARSIYSLMRHRSSGKIAGAVRLVLADPEDPAQPFPVEKFVSDPALANVVGMPRRQIAEISRLVLAKDFRSRDSEYQSPYGNDKAVKIHDTGGRRRFPHAVLGLFVAVVRMSAERGITHWYAFLEPVLNRLLRRFSLDLRSIGPAMEFHGLRQPCLGVADEILARAYEERREVWELLTEYGRIWPAPYREIYARNGTKRS